MADQTALRPYASELFGIYQPLLGWRSARKMRRVEKARAAGVETFVASMLRDLRLAKILESRVPLADVTNVFRQPWWTDPDPRIRPLVERLADFTLDNGELGPRTREGWTSILEGLADDVNRGGPSVDEEAEDGVGDNPDAPHTEAPISVRGTFLDDLEPVLVVGNEAIYRADTLPSSEELAAVGGRRIGRSRTFFVAPQPARTQFEQFRRALVPSIVDYLATDHPEVLRASLRSQIAEWEDARNFIDPLESFTDAAPDAKSAFLSPVGLIQIYRQYFYELDAFEGPAVGHVWVSPGGSVELYEVHTRRSREERLVETTLDTTSRFESTVIEQDELSSAVSEQNQTTTSFGVSASGGFNFGVAQGNASANFDLTTATTDATTTTQRHSREQTDKLTQEIKRNYKTTFRETREVEDISSKRHVLSNPTTRLKNYELKRKMREVAVQLEYVDTQMCWQIYVDDPGAELAISELIHIAKPDDADSPPPPPEAPPLLAAKDTQTTINFPYSPTGGDAPDAIFENGVDNAGSGISIDHELLFTAVPPGPGYKLTNVSEVNVVGTNPQRWQPFVAASYHRQTDDSFTVRLDRVQFYGNPALRFTLELVWAPPAQDLTEYNKRLATYMEDNRRRQHEQYVDAVRERIRFTRAIKKRSGTILREEERTVVYRRLIGQLTQLPREESTHTISELIRSIFDLERMLYFVAPEWWAPRSHGDRFKGAAISTALPNPEDATQTTDVPTMQLTDDDTVGWGGVSESERASYPITEDSEPAAMGASLGWLLQLDGDDHRNAFLNSPWVKAVLPIRPGKETEAIAWLKQSAVEGADGLDEKYTGGVDREPTDADPTLEEALLTLADEVNVQSEKARQAAALTTEKLYQTGFNPLEGGFRADRIEKVLDEWREILPTDQIVAVEYEPMSNATGKKTGLSAWISSLFAR